MPRPRKQISQLKKQGTYRADRHEGKKDITIPTVKQILAPPKSLDDNGTKLWNHLLSNFLTMEKPFIGEIDLPILEKLCIADQECKKIYEKMNVTTDIMTYKHLNHEYHRHLNIVITLGNKFYMTPASRAAAIQGESKEDDNPVLAVLAEE